MAHATPARIADPWGKRTPYRRGQEWPDRVDKHLVVDEEDVQRWVPTASLLHSKGDAMDIAVADGLAPSHWDTAMDRIVRRSRELLDSDGPGSIGFYTTGQLFAEEYYTLATIARAGIGTDHLDGNTRLCTRDGGRGAEGDVRQPDRSI